MRILSWVVLLIALTGVCAGRLSAQGGSPEKPPDKEAAPSTEKLGGWLGISRPEFNSRMVAMGEKLFPAFQEILDSDGKGFNKYAVWKVFYLLSRMECDRSRFVDEAVKRLGSKDESHRRGAAVFLETTGSEREAGPLAILLLDEERGVRHAASRAIVAIGGQREVVTFDLVIQNASRYEQNGSPILNWYDVEVFERGRDELKARLQKEEKDKPKAPPPEKK